MVEIVSAKTQLRRVGGRWTGRCPFHEERTPSFSVNPVGKLYHCFGCGAGGDVITFVRETEGLDFVGGGGVARRSLPRRRSSTRRPRRRSEAAGATRAAARRCSTRPRASTSGTLGGIRGRARTRPTSPSAGSARRSAASSASVSPRAATGCSRERAGEGLRRRELTAAGLVNRRGNDYFAGRLVFPLADARGRVLGFGARRLSDDDPIKAKYVNSPESELFHKASLVYGLDRARARDRQGGPRDRRRGVHRRPRAPPGGPLAAVAAHGNGAHRAAAQASCAALLAPLPVLRRRHGRRGATLRGMELAYGEFARCASSPCRPAPIRPRRPRGSRSDSQAAESATRATA